MDFVYKRTSELSESEISEICVVFNKVYEGNSKSISEFKNEFSNTPLGDSIHVLVIDGEKIVGANSYIPFTYFIDNKKLLFALSVDTMILTQFRNYDNIYKLWVLGRKILKEEGIAFLFYFPNENSYPLGIKGFRDKDVGDLSIYVLPYKISAVKPKLKFLNIISRLICKMLILFSWIFTNRKVLEYRIRKDRVEFNKARYKWFNGDYKIVNQADFSFVYKIINYTGIETAFLMDVHPMSKRNFDKAVRLMYKIDRNKFELALYIGSLSFSPFSMLKLPKKYEPKTFHFIGTILDRSVIDNDVIFNLKHWDVNLSNYDLL